MMKFIAVCFAVLVAAALASDEITHLPGFSGTIPFKQYSGYVNVNETNGRYLFYWFAESQSNPSTDPVVLWLNGGPGCSSVLGLLTEHGPFTAQKDGKTLVSNPYSWNKVANMIYLESPAGVGFSYSNTPSDYKRCYDDKSAMDVYNFLVKFFAMYPQFSKNEFFVAGESYAGHYVPTTVNTVYDQNALGKNPKINLKGFLVGNGVSDTNSDGNSVPPFLWQHNLVSIQMYNAANTNCKGDYVKNQNIPACQTSLNNLYMAISGVNPYNIYAKCDQGNMKAVKTEWLNQLNTTKNGGKHPLFTFAQNIAITIPCTDMSYVESYLNTPEVKTALHAQQTTKWEVCNGEINRNYDWEYESMLPFYRKLLVNGGLRARVYSGDCDFAVNTYGTQSSMFNLQFKVAQSWRAWHVDSQVAGFHQVYDNNLEFVTVRSAGHMVPTDRPAEALVLFSTFLKSQPLSE